MITYNKIYYVILLIIIVLVLWLVYDFIQNKAEADNILANIPQPCPIDKSPMIFLSPDLPQTDWGGWWGPRTEEKLPPVATTSPKPNFILTGIIIAPPSATAFILIPTKNNEERVCKVGDKIDDWEVIEIITNEVKIKNSRSGIVESLPLQKQWPNMTTSPNQVNDVIRSLTNAVNIPGIPPELIQKVLDGTEPVEQVNIYIKSAVASLPPPYVKELITKFTDITEDDMPSDNTKLGEYAVNLFRIFEGESSVSSTAVAENVLFTTSVNADNSPISPTIFFKPGDRQIYACFANQGALTGLAKLVHRWTYKNTGVIEKLETRPIDPNAPFNFIWVRKTEGWQVGEYEVELFKTQTLEKIAGGNFSVAP